MGSSASHRRSSAGAERPVAGRLVAVVALIAALVVVMGLISPADAPSSEAVGLLRVGTTSLLSVALLLGPGLVLRARTRCRLRLGLLPLPGIAVLAGVGGLVFVTAPDLDPHTVSAVALLVVLLGLAILAWRGVTLPDREERRVLGLTAVVYAVALGRSLWSLGPAGDLYAGTISRTLEVGDRPDSRISYHITSLVTHGLSPYSDAGASLFFPYTFSDRGPVPGFASTPIMLATGATSTIGFPDATWSVFDPQGFMAYRIVMMMLALTAVLAVYSLTRTVAGADTAWVAALVVAATPFFVHEVYFTWPKLAAAAMCVLAADLVIRGRPLAAGLLAGLGFLMHPLALVAVPTLLLVGLLVQARRHGQRLLVPLAVSTAGTMLGTGLVVGAWRLLNAGHPSPSNFTDYVFAANGAVSAPLPVWLESRVTSVANTLVPLHLPLADADNPSINAVQAPSDSLVHFFFQYWTGVPFGLAIVFFPALLVGLVILARRRPWVVVWMVLTPFVLFAVYWGSSESGLLREGMHPWVLGLLVVWAMHLEPGLRGSRGVPRWLRWVLVARALEVAVMLLTPTIDGEHRLVGTGHLLGDIVALTLTASAVVALALLTWRGTAPCAFGHAPTSEPELRDHGARPAGAHR